MAVDVTIEGVSFIGGHNEYGRYWVELETVDIDQDIGAQQTSAEFDVYIEGMYANGAWMWPIVRPKAGQEVIFTNNDGTREFGGIMTNPEEDELAPNLMVYHCKCSDFTQWFDRHLVNATYPENSSMVGLVNKVVEDYVNTPDNSRTFTTNNVQQYPDITLPILQFVYLPPSQVLSQLANMTGWGFFIDFYRDVNLYSTEYLTSPLPNNTLNADDLVGTQSLSEEQLAAWIDLKISEDSSQLKNEVFITGIYIAQDTQYQETFLGDGVTKVFTLAYMPPNDVTNITVDVGGTLYQIAEDLVNGYPGGPYEPQTVYVNFSQQTVRFGEPPASGVQIVVDYYPMTQTVVGQNSIKAQQYMASIDGTDGIYQYNRMDPSLSAELPSLAQERAQITLNKYAYPIVQGQFTSYIGGWRVGQWFWFRSQRRMQGDYDGDQFFVIKVTKKIIQVAESGEWTFQTTVQFSSIPFSL